MTTQQPKSTTCFITPIVSELAEQSTRAKPTINKSKKKTKFKTKSMKICPQKKKKNPFSRTRWNIKENTHACHIPIDLPRRAAISISFVVESELVSTWYSTPSKKKEKKKKTHKKQTYK